MPHARVPPEAPPPHRPVSHRPAAPRRRHSPARLAAVAWRAGLASLLLPAAAGADTQQTASAGPTMELGTGTDAQPAAPTINVDVPGISAAYQRLDDARSQLLPSLGATRYEFGRDSLETLPGGDNDLLNGVLLQAPGVAQDSYGQIHVRGDHNEVQFRLDGVQLPEGLSVFGQVLESRFAHSLSLITGALPAQYGFDTAGIIDIRTKSGLTDPGGEVSIYGGARDFFQPSFSYGGAQGVFDWFVTGDLLHTRLGIENPIDSFNAVHDLSNQTHGLIHVGALIDPTARVSLLAGASNAAFQIPNVPGQTPQLGLSVDGTTTLDSASLNAHQREITDFVILSLQKQAGPIDLQTSVFSRYSSLAYSPDPLGDLLYLGVGQTAARSVWSSGEQTDASWHVNSSHTLRAGFQVFAERNSTSTDSEVLAATGGDTGTTNGAGVASTIQPNGSVGTAQSSQPFNIHQGQGLTGTIYGLYLQDEWHALPHVTVNLGVRFDRVDEYTHEQQVSPRVNVVWLPAVGTTVHGGYSRYFVPPPFELVSGTNLSVFNGTTAAAGVTQDDTVKAERDNYYDLGVDQVVLPGLRIGLDAYYKDAQNLIDEGQFGAPIILSAFNYAQGEVHGVEASGSYDHGPLSLYANAALSRAIGKDIDSSQFNFSAEELAYISQHWIHLDHDQRWTGSGGAAYTLVPRPDSPLRLSTDLVVGSGLRADGSVPNGVALPGYYTFNLSAVQTIKTPCLRSVQLRLDVFNLLDRRYEIRNGTGVGVGAPQYGLRRTILAGLAARF